MFASVELKFLQVQSIMRIKEEEMYIMHWAIDFDHGFDGAADFFLGELQELSRPPVYLPQLIALASHNNAIQ